MESEVVEVKDDLGKKMSMVAMNGIVAGWCYLLSEWVQINPDKNVSEFIEDRKNFINDMTSDLRKYMDFKDGNLFLRGYASNLFRSVMEMAKALPDVQSKEEN